MSFIQWCPVCNGKILTTRQIEEKKPCVDCQKVHAEKFHEKFNIREENNATEFNG